MKIPIDDIPQSPKEISFSERIEELNEIYAKGSARDFRFPPSLHVVLVYYRSGKELFFHGRFAGSIAASCSRCGADLNLEACACSATIGDPRMAVFRTLKVDR